MPIGNGLRGIPDDAVQPRAAGTLDLSALLVAAQ